MKNDYRSFFLDAWDIQKAERPSGIAWMYLVTALWQPGRTLTNPWPLHTGPFKIKFLKKKKANIRNTKLHWLFIKVNAKCRCIASLKII